VLEVVVSFELLEVVSVDESPLPCSAEAGTVSAKPLTTKSAAKLSVNLFMFFMYLYSITFINCVKLMPILER
jgi:hypothetical protein